jgi:hypothetical protein
MHKHKGSKSEQKRAMLQVSQYLTSNYITEPKGPKQHAIDTKTDMWTKGIE